MKDLTQIIKFSPIDTKEDELSAAASTDVVNEEIYNYFIESQTYRAKTKILQNPENPEFPIIEECYTGPNGQKIKVRRKYVEFGEGSVGHSDYWLFNCSDEEAEKHISELIRMYSQLDLAG